MNNLYEVDINVRNIKFIKGLVEAYDINGVLSAVKNRYSNLPLNKCEIDIKEAKIRRGVKYNFYITTVGISDKNFKKSIINYLCAINLKVGEKVRVYKTGETGVITGFNEYTDSKHSRVVPYITVTVKMDNPGGKKTKKNYSGSSLVKI